MKRFYEENKQNEQSTCVFFDVRNEQPWNTFSPSMEEKDLYEYPAALYGTLDQTVFNMKLEF